MSQPPPPATCARCGAWNPPAAARCSTCGVGLAGTPTVRHEPGDERVARLAGFGLILGSVVVIALLLPTALGAVGRAPDATSIAIASATAPPASPAPAATRAPAPTAIPSPSAAPPTQAPDPTPDPTPDPDDPGSDADHVIGGAPDATAAPAPTPAPDAAGTVDLPKLSVDIAGATTIDYFGISGRGPGDLIRSMERNAASHCESREALACVALRPDIRPTYRITSTGSCVLTGAATSLDATVYIPRWIKPTRVHPELLAWWREVLDHIAWHEGRHIRIEKTWLKKAPGMLEGKACSSGQRVIDRWARKVAEAQAAFDADDYVSYDYPAYSGRVGS